MQYDKYRASEKSPSHMEPLKGSKILGPDLTNVSYDSLLSGLSLAFRKTEIVVLTQKHIQTIILMGVGELNLETAWDCILLQLIRGGQK